MIRDANSARAGTIAGLLGLSLLLSGCAAITDFVGADGEAKTEGAPLVIYGFEMAVELAPIHLAARELYGDGAVIRNGGVSGLIGPDHEGDVAANAEMQILRASVTDPNVRSIMTVAEGHYPIVARRSAGISSIADLKGKRIMSRSHIPTTSMFFLHKMLAREGLTLSDVTFVNAELGEISAGLANGQYDAVAIWEPDSENSIRALRDLGEDAVIFSGLGVFHERYNLSTTAEALADPAKRREIVRLVRAIIDASEAINTDPATAAAAQAIVAKSGGLYTVTEVARSWPNVRFVATWDDSLLDLLVEEENWLAPQENRQPRPREELARLIDRSVYDEAMAMGR